jgi:hypothetical protein
MFPLFQTYVASVSSGYCICCSGYTCMLQVCFFKCLSCFRRMLQVFYLYVAYVAVVIYIYCKHMFQLFHLVSVCCNKCYSPRILTHGHARAACTHLALAISVMRTSSNSWMCKQWAISAQTAEHSLVKSACAHAKRQSGPTPNRRRTRPPCTTRLGPHGGAYN